MIDNCENINCFDLVCEYADSRGIVSQRCSIELSVQRQTERERASSIDKHAGLILWRTRWFD